MSWWRNLSLKTKIITIFSVVAVFGAVLIGYSAYQGSRSRGLGIKMSGPEKVLIGVPFEFEIDVANVSQNVLEDVRLTVTLPAGMAFVGAPSAKNTDFRDLKTLAAGGVSQQAFKLVALNGENSFKRIEVSANFLSGSLSSRFQKNDAYDLAVGGYGLTLDIAAPQKIFGGENFDTEISYKNVSDMDFSDLKLKIDFPPTFKLVKSTLEPDIGNNVWILGGLRRGSEMKFKINGNILGPDGAFFDIKATIEAVLLGQSYPISVNTATLSIATSPLSIKMEANGDPDYVAGPDESITYDINYSNNTDVGLQNVVIKTQLIGAMYDFATLDSDAIYRSSDNTLTWNASNAAELATLSPGESGAVHFTIRTKKAYPISRLSDRNFVLKVAGSIESPTVPNFVAATKTVGLANLETKVGGKADIATKVYFRDAASGIINKGPFPPRVNQKTNYTIHWQITNYGTDIKDVEVKAFLAGNVKFTGVTKTNASSAPVYNDLTQEVVWKINKVQATTGVISGPLEATFQIEATPSSLDAGTFMPLIQDTSLKATDDFTGREISAGSFSVTTQLPDDTTISPNQGIVRE